MFNQKVDLRIRQSMTDFLKNHFRYHTMNSCNNSTSYANCIKVHRLPHDTSGIDNDTLFDMLQCDEWSMIMSSIIAAFERAHNYNWQIGTNGRSGGYLVLYRGGLKDGRPFCWPGKSVDQDGDFSECDMDDLRARVKLVQEFDTTCDEIVETYLEMCRTHTVEMQEILVPKEIAVDVPLGSL